MYWLFKSDPEAFSITDLIKAPNQTTLWDGVRNFQARNNVRDRVRVGDRVLYYHSTTEPVGIAGEVVVVREAYPDPTQFDPKHRQYEPRSTSLKPFWYAVDVKFVRACKLIITRDRLRSIPALRSMLVLKRGIRLSVQPVIESEWKTIMSLPEWD